MLRAHTSSRSGTASTRLLPRLQATPSLRPLFLAQRSSPDTTRLTRHASRLAPPPRSSLSRRPWRSGHKEKISAMDFFAYMDKDSSGSISKAEFSSALIK